MLHCLFFVLQFIHQQHEVNKMQKFTTKQLQDALIAMFKAKSCDDAYQMTFEEINKRMGDEAFDAWCDTWYV